MKARYVFVTALSELTLLPRGEVTGADRTRVAPAVVPLTELPRWAARPFDRRALLALRDELVGPGDPASLVADLSEALQRGDLVALARPRARVIVEVEGLSAAEVLGPEAEATTWFEVRLIDEVGEPLSGVALTFSLGGKKEKASTDGGGKARVEGPGGIASVQIDKEAEVRKLLRDRWSKPRGKPWYAPAPEEEATTTAVEVHRKVPLPSVTVPAEEPHTVVFQPRVVQANLKGMWFATSKCFLLPTARHSLQLVKALYDQNPETDMLVVGHTDRAGTPGYNDPLSLERAGSVVAYLKDDVDAWYAWYGSGKPQEKRWGAEEDELMIRALAEESGEAIPPAEGPVRWYQRTRGLDVDGKAGEKTRKALLAEYMKLDGTSLPADIVPVAHGCGENFPAVKTADGVAEQQNRRVEIFFFENPTAPPERPGAVLPPPSGKNSAPGSKEYPEWLTRVRELHEFEVGHWIRVLMRYDDGTVAQNVPFVIRYSDGSEKTAITSDDGILMIHGVPEQSWSIQGIEDPSVILGIQ